MYQKIVSVLLIPILFFYTLMPAAFGAKTNKECFQISDLKNLHTLSDYINYVQERGAASEEFVPKFDGTGVLAK